MNVSTNGFALIKHYEGCRLHSYRDGGGVWTIAWGHTPARAGEVVTQEEADALLATDVGEVEHAILELVHVDLSQGEFDALASFVFNLGRGHLAQSHLLQKLNAGDRSGAAAEFTKWDRIGSLVSAGLLDRRSAEAHLFKTGQVVFF